MEAERAEALKCDEELSDLDTSSQTFQQTEVDESDCVIFPRRFEGAEIALRGMEMERTYVHESNEDYEEDYMTLSKTEYTKIESMKHEDDDINTGSYENNSAKSVEGHAETDTDIAESHPTTVSVKKEIQENSDDEYGHKNKSQGNKVLPEGSEIFVAKPQPKIGNNEPSTSSRSDVEDAEVDYESKKDDILKEEEMEDEQEVYCICRKSDIDRFMICCDNCTEWFHGDCINLPKHEAKKIKTWYCQLCMEKNSELSIEFKSKKMKPPGEVRSKSQSKTSKRISRMCGECIACRKAEDCGQCDFCRDKRKYGGQDKIRQKCRLRQCLKLSRKISNHQGKFHYPEDYIRQFKAFQEQLSMDSFNQDSFQSSSQDSFQSPSQDSFQSPSQDSFQSPSQVSSQTFQNAFSNFPQLSRESSSQDSMENIKDEIVRITVENGVETTTRTESVEVFMIDGPPKKKAIKVKHAKQPLQDKEKKRKEKGEKERLRKEQKERKMRDLHKKKEDREERRRKAAEEKKRRLCTLRSESATYKRQESTKKEKQRHCLGPGCINAAASNSKYCSDECGVQLALRRLQEILPSRKKIWKETVIEANRIAEEKLEDLRQEQVRAQTKLLEYDKKYESLEAVVERSKELTVDEDDIIDDTVEGDIDLTTYCVSCGVPCAPKVVLRHMEKCYTKLECLMSFGSTYRSVGNLFCDTYTPQQGTFCKRLRILCPEHTKDPKIGPDDVCGCPLVNDDYKETTQLCRAPKRKCTRHHLWEKLRRAEIDLQRLQQWWKLEDVVEQERSIRVSVANRGGVVGILLHETIDHSKSQVIEGVS